MLYYMEGLIISGTILLVCILIIFSTKTFIIKSVKKSPYLLCLKYMDSVRYIKNRSETDIYIIKSKVKRMEDFKFIDLIILVSAIITGLKFIIFDYFISLNTYPKSGTKLNVSSINQYGLTNSDFFISSITVIIISIVLYIYKEIIVTNFKKAFFHIKIKENVKKDPF